MGYTVEHLERSRANGFEPLNVFRATLAALLGLDGRPVRLLDCGCGTGFFTRQYARIGGVAATGLDVDESLLAAAREIAAAEALSIDFVQGDILCLPYPDDAFDVVASDILLEIFPDQQAPIGEMLRVCKPGGRILCMEPNYQSFVYFDPRLPQEENLRRIREENAAHAFGAGVELPDAMFRLGVEQMQLVPWFWGGCAISAGGALQRAAAVLSGIDVYLVCGRKPDGQSKRGACAASLHRRAPG